MEENDSNERLSKWSFVFFFKRCVIINKSKELWLSGIALKLYSTGQVYQVTVHGTAAYLSIELVSVALVLLNTVQLYNVIL